MHKPKNYLTFTMVGVDRRTYSLPALLVRSGLIALLGMVCVSLLAWTALDLRPLQNYRWINSQNQLLRTKARLLYQKNYDLSKQDMLLAEEIRMLEALISAEDADVFHFNSDYKMVSIEENVIGWRVIQYKLKIGDRALYEYVTDRMRTKEYAALQEKLALMQKNLEKLIQTNQFTPEIRVIELPDKEYVGLVGDLVVLSVSKVDALHLQTDGRSIAEQYKKVLQKELKIAKENKFLQETPIIGSVGIVDQKTSLKELSKQIAIRQDSNQSVLYKNNELMAKTYNKALEYKTNYARTPSMYPLRYVEISSPYGYRVHPVTNAMSVHYGLDMVAVPGTKVIATADGRVVSSGWNGGYGLAVQISHGMGMSTIYGHCSELLVSRGQYVKKGAVIALSGDSGLSNGPHLHYEIRRWNVAIDPTPYLRRDILTASKGWVSK